MIPVFKFSTLWADGLQLGSVLCKGFKMSAEMSWEALSVFNSSPDQSNG